MTAVVASPASWQPSSSECSSPQGINRKTGAWLSPSRGGTPGGFPKQAISPRSLIETASVNCTPAPGGTKVFKSIIGPPSSHRNGCKQLVQSDEQPTT